MKLKNDIIIAIDGFASCGKSTLAKKLAKTLGYTYIDTGAMYRAVTLFALENKIITGTLDKQKLIDSLGKINIEFKYNPQTGANETYLNGRNVEKIIRMDKNVADWVSPVAEIPEVRKHLVFIQQQMGKNKRIVMDGRDIGTVVFPGAELKLFLTASPEERARRRYKELTAKGSNITFEEVRQNVIQRDKIDSTREASPLKPAKDAIIIDNTNIGIDEQFYMVLAIIAERFGYGADCLEA